MCDMNVDTNWIVTAPGRIVLPTTKYVIEWDGADWPVITWDGKRIAGWALSLTSAKQAVQKHMRELIGMGIEP